MEFWLAVRPISRALIAHSTAGQCSVVKRAPTPSVLRPSRAPAVGKIVEPASCSWMRFFSLSRLSQVAGKAARPGLVDTPSASTRLGSVSVLDSKRHAQSPVAACSTSVQVPAAVSKVDFG